MMAGPRRLSDAVPTQGPCTPPVNTETWDDEACVLHVDDPRGAPVMLVFFAGIGGAFGGLPAFEFRHTVARVRTNQVFVRDPSSLWYLKGVRGAGSSAEELAAYLREECRRRGAKRVVTVGNSAGGYAAILFGVLIGADEVHAFSPKTRLLERSDFHSEAKLRILLDHVGRDHPYLDLTRFLAEHADGPTLIHIHYANGDKVDATHALRVKGLPNVRLWRYRWRTHALVKVLKDYGVLRPILTSAIAGSPVRLKLIFRWVLFRMRLSAIRSSIARRMPGGGAGETSSAAD